MRITKTVKIATATGVAGYDICDANELKGLSKALGIISMGWVGSDAAYDTQLQIQDGQATPISLHNADVVASGLDFAKHVRQLNYTPKSGEVSIQFDVSLGAGDAIIFVDAIIPDS
jgi:hypothetical protein